MNKLFQSTLPVRGATVALVPHNPAMRISIHAPRAGSDSRPQILKSGEVSKFQSTLPVRGATLPMGDLTCPMDYFNPRSPCGERHYSLTIYYYEDIFQSTLPVRGATPCSPFYHILGAKFQSTLPVRGATGHDKRNERRQIFQSTLPVRGVTANWKVLDTLVLYFNPRSPCGERL